MSRNIERMQRARDMALVKSFGAVLRQMRSAAGWTQEQLAFEAGIDRTFVGLLESGRRQPSLSVVFALAAALGNSPEDIVRLTREAYASGIHAPEPELGR